MERIGWVKKGKIFNPQGDAPWLKSHAMLPTVAMSGANSVQIYFGSRNDDNQSHIGSFVFNLNDYKVLEKTSTPHLTPGKLGTFDDNGVLPSCIFENDDNKYMYYIGFKPGGTTRMDLFGGLAKFSVDSVLERISEAPILERSKVNPYINTAPFIIENQTKDRSEYRYFMYYVAGCGWLHRDLPKYNIQVAFSNDGVNWDRKGKICIDFKDDYEVALARPWVIFWKNKYHMWFSYKGGCYRIGYATSNDGIRWERDDFIGGLDPSLESSDFDSEMTCYGAVIPYQNKLLMFYNGNGYGKTGIGLAEYNG